MDLQNAIQVEIFNQMGGNKFVAMTGSKNFLSGKDEGAHFLEMTIVKNKTAANRFRITYVDSTDTYCLHFYRFYMKDLRPQRDTVKFIEMVYGEDLQRIFKQTTGLDTKL